MKNRLFKIAGLMLTLCIVAETGRAQAPEQEKSGHFHYLQFQGQKLESTHAIRHALKIPEGFAVTDILNHTPSFNDHPFNVSTAAMYSADRIIMVHAEAVSDSSGYLDYSYMDCTLLNGMKFYTQETCIVITDDLLSQATDLKFFQDAGFDFFPAIYLKQFFQYSEDGNYEYVLSYGEKVMDCSDTTINKVFKKQNKKRLKEVVEFDR